MLGYLTRTSYCRWAFEADVFRFCVGAFGLSIWILGGSLSEVSLLMMDESSIYLRLFSLRVS